MDRSQAPVRILLADGHAIFRSGLKRLLELEPGFRVVAEAGELREAIRLAGEARPDVLLIDLHMPGLSNTKELRLISARAQKARMLVLAGVSLSEEIAEAFKLGARGVVLKDSSIKILIQGIRCVLDGRLWVGYEPVAGVSVGSLQLPDASKGKTPQKTFGLTARELEIVSAIVSGYSNKEIAGKLTISEDTVKHHVSNIFDKVGAYNRLELALFAIHHGLAGRRQTQAGRKVTPKVSADVA